MIAVFLDTGVLGMLTNPNASEANATCQQWVKNLVESGTSVLVPSIADYKLRRELLRAPKTAGIKRLDIVNEALGVLHLTAPAMFLAAELWAKARKEAYPTADDKALDGDVILAAQVLTAGLPLSQVVVATTNVGHLQHFVDAKEWRDIAL